MTLIPRPVMCPPTQEYTKTMNNDSLGNIIKSATARAFVYSAWVISGILIGAAQMAFIDPDPQWLTTTFNVWSYLGIFIGSLAVVNSSAVPTKVIEVERAQVVNADVANVAEGNVSEGNTPAE